MAAVLGTVIAFGLGEPGSDQHAAALKMLGEAYAKDNGTTLERVETRVSATVTAANMAQSTERLRKALSLGLVGKDQSFKTLTLDELEGAVAFKMANGKPPAEAVAGLLEPGLVLVEATWKFPRSPPVTSLAVFTNQGELVFDSLLSFPAMPESMLFPKHL